MPCFQGTDIVELTGNHMLDRGPEAMLYTLGLYNQLGWPYYGGGANLDDARKPATIENNGNRLAFIGCNPVGQNGEWAGPDTPGAAPCGDYSYMRSEITSLTQEGYLVIATFQYFEYYHYGPTSEQTADFRSMADAGAVIVSGSQAHHPQTFAFDGNSLIHYGLGNLFFDQYYESQETRYAFLDRHVFYNGRYLGADLLTILFTDNAHSRFMTPAERADFLGTVFSAAGW